MSIPQRGRAQAAGEGVLGDKTMQSSPPGITFPWPPLLLSPLSGGFVSACCPLLAFCSLDCSVQIPDLSFPRVVTWGKLLNLRFLNHRIGEMIVPISEYTVRDTAVNIRAIGKALLPYLSRSPFSDFLRCLLCIV